MTIGILPDEALLEAFYWHLDDYLYSGKWIALVHVCRRWRYIIFASPLRLNLRLLCTPRTPVRKLLDIWPPLPIVIHTQDYSEEGADNIIAALEHNDRVCSIHIHFERDASLAFGRFATAMQEPFPELTHLTLLLCDESTLVVPETFLGGSVPHLRFCRLDYIPFPVLQKSASHLVTLEFTHIPHSGYISPEAMVACLSAATSLKHLELGFQSPQSRPDRASRRPPPLKRTILPALTNFIFHGVSGYLEDFIARVNIPLLEMAYINLFHQLTFDISQLHQFIRRTETLSTLNTATVFLSNRYSRVELYQTMQLSLSSSISLSVWCSESDWQLSFLAQACNSLSPALSTFETLVIREDGFPSLSPGWEDDMENSQWLELFHPFTSLKNLYLSQKFIPLVAPALQQLVAESVIGVLPALQNLYLEGLQSLVPIQGIGQFVAARELFNHPVTVTSWDGFQP